MKNFNKNPISDYGMRIPLLINGWEPSTDEMNPDTFDYTNYFIAMGKVAVKFFDTNYGKIIRKTFPDAKFKFDSIEGDNGMATLEIKHNISNKEIHEFIESKLNSKAFNQFLTDYYGSYVGFYSFMPNNANDLLKVKHPEWKADVVFGFLLKNLFNSKEKIAKEQENLMWFLTENDCVSEFNPD